MALKYSTVKMIECSDWDAFVTEAYGRPYDIQQQDGCRNRGIVDLTVPDPYADIDDEDMADSIPEVVNGPEMGVKFSSWLARDPLQPLSGRPEDATGLSLWWERNFYPTLGKVANDLHSRGLLEAGEYVINIDW